MLKTIRKISVGMMNQLRIARSLMPRRAAAGVLRSDGIAMAMEGFCDRLAASHGRTRGPVLALARQEPKVQAAAHRAHGTRNERPGRGPARSSVRPGYLACPYYLKVAAQSFSSPL